jgi:hypothetical protein
MVFKFRLISDEEKDFIRDIEVLSDQTFYDLHYIMTEDFNYDRSQLASFFLTNQEWEKEQEFTLFDMSEGKNSKTLLMDKSVIGHFVNDHKQRLIYVFDIFNERILFMELTKIKSNVSSGRFPRITFSKGHAPRQILKGISNFDGLILDA